MKLIRSLAFLATLSVFSQGADAPAIYRNDFQKVPRDKLPEEFLVIAGTFEIKTEKENVFLELAGAPLDTFGLLFGPTEQTGLSASARFFGTKQGRRFPTFAISLNGIAGYRLQINPAKRAIEIYRGDEQKASAPYEWQSGTWNTLRLQLRTVEGKPVAEGKAWSGDATAEPSKWTIQFKDSEDVPPGRPGIWGTPYAGTPIRFDDLIVTKATSE
jgi:hypothetical protein